MHFKAFPSFGELKASWGEIKGYYKIQCYKKIRLYIEDFIGGNCALQDFMIGLKGLIDLCVVVRILPTKHLKGVSRASQARPKSVNLASILDKSRIIFSGLMSR